jgi:lambda family phage portal protein
VPFALELLDVDMLDDRISVLNKGRNEIRLGIEVDEWGRAIAYWLFESHPGDIWNVRGNSYYSRPVPANDIIHIFNRAGFRPGQTRGVPALHAAILKARNLLGFEESELIKARIQACVTAFVESEYSDAEPLGTDDQGYPLKELFPGAIEYLDPGQKIAPFDPSSPNPNAPAFIKHFQRAIARVLGMSSYAVTGDLSDANYSSLREGKLSEWRRVKIMRDQLATDFCAPVFRRWLDAAAMSGFVALPPDYESNHHRYCQCQWFGSPMPWVDPMKDIGAIEKEIQIGLTTQKRELAKRGVDFEDWCAEKQQEKEILERYGLDAPMAGNDPQPEMKPEEEDAPLVEGMQSVKPQQSDTQARALVDFISSVFLPKDPDGDDAITPEVLPPVERACCGEFEGKEKEDENITINISINGNQLMASPESEDEEEEEEYEEMDGTAIGDYSLLPGFAPVRELYGERKIKAKKKKNCSKGQVCGFSCISKLSTCKADMTAAQFMEHNKAKRLERAEKRKAVKGGASIINSPEATGIVEQAKRIKAEDLKRGDVVKFARWGVGQPDGTMPVFESTVKVVSVDGQDVRARVGNQKSISTITDATDGYFYPKDSLPELAHYLQNAQKEVKKLPALENRLESVNSKIDNYPKQNHPYGSPEFKKQKQELDALFDEAIQLSADVNKASGYINKASTMLNSHLSNPMRSFRDYDVMSIGSASNDIDILLSKLNKLVADVIGKKADIELFLLSFEPTQTPED